MAAIAHEHGAVCVVDNTFVTPIFQRPLALGVYLVLHASTKYIGGHGDVFGGVLALPSMVAVELEMIVQLQSGGHATFTRCLRRFSARVADRVHSRN